MNAAGPVSLPLACVGVVNNSAVTDPSASTSFPSSITALAIEAAKTAEMVEKLPAVCYPDDGVIVPLLQEAGVQSFFVNVRSLIEFLEVKPAEKDRSASNLLPNWTPPEDHARRTRLVQHWRTASQHLMHFGQVRTKQEDGTVEVVNVEKAALQTIAGDVLGPLRRIRRTG
jgi:hypothetical protein